MGLLTAEVGELRSALRRLVEAIGNDVVVSSETYEAAQDARRLLNGAAAAQRVPV